MSQTQNNQDELGQVKHELVDALERRRRNCAEGDSPKRINAMVIARRFHHLYPFAGRSRTNRESLKRAVRDVVNLRRREGVPVLADRLGYYLPISAADHAAYQEFRKRNGLAHLAAASADARSLAASDAVGQFRLFDEPSEARH